MSSADRRSGVFCAGTENAPLRVADSANARQREKSEAFSRGTAKPRWTNLLHMNAPASRGNRRFTGLLPERDMHCKEYASV